MHSGVPSGHPSRFFYLERWDCGVGKIIDFAKSLGWVGTWILDQYLHVTIL